MKHIKLESPDKSNHNIMVNSFKYNKKDDNYLINYYDLTESSKKNAILEKNNNDFYVVSTNKDRKDNDLEEINISLLPKIIKYQQKKEEKKKITVYQTKYALFINENLCNYYNIAKNNNKRSIKGIPCLEITKRDLEEIINKTNAEINYIPTYETKISRNYNYYELNNKLYITRNIYELIKASNLELAGTPKIIDNKNCYLITSEQLEAFNNKLHLHGRKISLTKNTTIVYHDINNNKLYLPIKTECIHSDEIIMNKKCQEITSNELNNISKAIIANVFRNTQPKTTREVIVCSYEDKIYIKNDIIKEFSISQKETEKIKIADNIYLKISADILDSIKEKASKKNVTIKFNIKKIAPKKTIN